MADVVGIISGIAAGSVVATVATRMSGYQIVSMEGGLMGLAAGIPTALIVDATIIESKRQKAILDNAMETDAV